MTHRRTWLLAATILFLAAGLSPRAARLHAAAQKQKKGAAAAATGLLATDKGKLRILLDGRQVGAEEFEIAADGGNWMARGAVQLTPADGPATRVTSALRLQPDGAPLSYEWSSQSDKKNGAHILFENGIAKINLEVEGARPFQQELTFASPRIAILDNNLYHHYAILARLYDWSKRGPQVFPVLIPQDLTPGSITVEATGTQTSAGKSYEGLRVSTADLEVLLYLDAQHRLQRLEVPAASVTVVRE
ncbi:MAG: hypothetical protein LAN84_02995 [Acidobacteriia bacterium]|nr:hypothetical protein [Terriglobia bacterium]